MSAPRTRRRWLELLRRTAGVSQDPTPALEDAGLWEARDRAAKAAHDAEKLGERVVASSARHRTNADGAAERASNALSRRQGLAANLRHIQDSFERIGVVGLNAGLEGARAPETMGRGLTLVSEEIRSHAGRGADAARELATNLNDLMDIVVDLSQRLERVQREVHELSADATQLKVAVQESVTSLADLEVRLRKATGLDPETAKYIGQVGEHAKGLLGALAALEGAGAKHAAISLVPLLTPVMKVLSGIVSEDGAPPSSGSS
jgi:hypothetical protein